MKTPKKYLGWFLVGMGAILLLLTGAAVVSVTNVQIATISRNLTTPASGNINVPSGVVAYFGPGSTIDADASATVIGFGGGGPNLTQNLTFYGDGSDGVGYVSTASGNLSLLRDYYFTNLTINGTGVLYPQNFRVFVSGILDISAAGTSSISGVGSPGGSAVFNVAGNVPTGLNFAYFGQGQPPTPAAGSATSTNGSAANSPFQNWGGSGGSGGHGGLSATNAGGTGGVVAVTGYPKFVLHVPTPSPLLPEITTSTGISATSLGSGGGPGAPGGTGAGDGVTSSGGGAGSGGYGGSVVALFANTILRGGTSNNIINVNGGNGGNGGAGGNTTIVSGNIGGAGGSGGGGGGWVLIITNALTGPADTNAISFSAGNGGAGGNGNVTGGLGGQGGTGGNGGIYELFNLGQATATIINNTNYGAPAPAVPVTVTGNLGTLGNVSAATGL